MILCLAKSDRAQPLFKALAELDPRYVDGGIVGPTRSAKAAGRLLSASTSRAAARNEAQFSPNVLNSFERACAQRVSSFGPNVEAVLIWGAMGRPVPRGSNLPYYVITDGPYDPNDPIYPVEWSPGRWKQDYLARQRDVFCGAERVFTLSNWARDKVISVHGIDPERVVKIGWGPMATVGEPILDPKDVQPYFVSVGNEWYRKGMDVVADAGQLLHQRRPEFTTYTVGDPAGLVIPPTPGVQLIPKILPSAEVQALLRQATGTIVASRFDASPHVIFESLQYGTPVIGCSACGIAEGVQAPRGGLVLGNLRSEELAAAMWNVAETVTTIQRSAAHEVYCTSGIWSQAATRVLTGVNEGSMGEGVLSHV